MKKTWNTPQLTSLGVEKTQAGMGPITISDDNYLDADGKTWYSFPDSASQ